MIMMSFAGIDLKRPTLSGAATYALVGVAFWMMGLALVRVTTDAWMSLDLAGAWLIVAVWSAVSNEMGISARKGIRHFGVLFLATAALLGVYALAMVVVRSL